MARWAPGASDRLRTVALDLFLAQGYEQTTAAEIAAAAGLTERTFYRYFEDKREVLFGGQEVLRAAFVDAVAAAPAGVAPLEIMAFSLEQSAAFFEEGRRPWSRRRNVVIAANPALRERELLKMAALAEALAEALRERGVPEPASTLAAESGITVFRVSFERWVADDEERPLAAIEREVLAELLGLAAHPQTT